MKLIPFLTCFILLLPNNLISQDDSKDPIFTTFEGVVYKMPKMNLMIRGRVTKTILERYAHKVYEYDSLTTISLETIDIPETIITKGQFPGVPQLTKFCMLLDSEMTILEDGLYEFILISDDGSILWIDEDEVVNNDGGHPMRLKKETVPLQAGVYPIKMWYFQGHPDRFGFKFDARYKGPIPKTTPTNINLSAELLFNFRESSLTDKAKTAIRQMVNELDIENINSIKIIGHTDNIGTPEQNMTLSIRRAESVAEYVKQIIERKEIQINVIGKGESDPISSNESKNGRAENRRVQISYF